MDEQITFLPWLRRGLAQALTTTGPLSGPLAARPGDHRVAWTCSTPSDARRCGCTGPTR